ncbi:MAG: hypothetical protein P8125_11970 [Gemmatimonadota bacterium]
MRWRIPLVAVLALFTLAAVSCDRPPPTAPESASVTETTPLFLKGGIGAVVTKGDIGCALIDGYGNAYPPDYTGNCGTEVGTWSRNGTAIFTTKMTGVPNPTGRTIHYGPFDVGSGDVLAANADLAPGPYPCYLLGADRDFDNFLATTNWRQTLTPSGGATITCVYTDKFAFAWPD